MLLCSNPTYTSEITSFLMSCPVFNCLSGPSTDVTLSTLKYSNLSMFYMQIYSNFQCPPFVVLHILNRSLSKMGLLRKYTFVAALQKIDIGDFGIWICHSQLFVRNNTASSYNIYHISHEGNDPLKSPMITPLFYVSFKHRCNFFFTRCAITSFLMSCL